MSSDDVVVDSNIYAMSPKHLITTLNHKRSNQRRLLTSPVTTNETFIQVSIGAAAAVVDHRRLSGKTAAGITTQVSAAVWGIGPHREMTAVITVTIIYGRHAEDEERSVLLAVIVL